MAIPISGKVSIGDIRTELQNTGTSNFQLSKAGRPTTGVPGTLQNPVYTPVNQSSSNIPNNSSPYSVSEWRRYNHSENLPCYSTSEIYLYYAVSGRVGELYKYDFVSNSVSLLEETFGASLLTSRDFAMTRSKLWDANPSSGGGGATNYLYEYDITTIPWTLTSNRTLTTTPNSDLALVLGGFVAKSNTLLVGYPHPNSYSATSSVYEANIETNTPTFTKLFNAAGVARIFGEIYYNQIANTYIFAYEKTNGNYAVGEYNTSGTLVNEVVTGSLAIDGLFEYSGTMYGIKDGDYNDIYELNLSSNTYTYIKTAPEIVDFLPDDPGFTWSLYVYGASQVKIEPTFTTSSLGKFYTYYRIALRGEVTYQSTIEVSGTDITNHWCYIYTSYPFNNVGQIDTSQSWTYSYFSSNTSKFFTRTMLSSSEVLHFVLFEDGN